MGKRSLAACFRYRWSLLWILLILAVAQPAAAQFDFQTERNRNSTDFTLLDSSPNFDPQASPIFWSLLYQYSSNPIGYNQGQDGAGTLVSGINTISLAGEYTISNRYSLGLDMPFHQLVYYQHGSSFAFGDLRFFGRAVVLNDPSGHDLKVSLVPSLYLPTGDKDLLLSNPDGGAGINLVAEKKWGSTHVALNWGVDYFPHAAYGDVNYEMQNYLGAGVKQDFSQKWSLNLEWMGRQIHDVHLGDLYAGADYKFTEERSVLFGAGLASSQFTEPNLEYNLFLGFRITPATTRVITQYVQKKIETVEKQVKIHDCNPKPYHFSFSARALRAAERRSLVLPYLSTPDHPVSMLDPGDSSGLTDTGAHYVKDGQVLFAIDVIDLPKPETVIALKAMTLDLQINKLWSENRDKTDMICILNEKVCSGDLYSRADMQQNINAQFFAGKEPPNDYFTQQIPPQMGPTLSRVAMHLSLPKLLENSLVSDALNLIYPGTPVSAGVTLYFAVAHEIFVRRKIKLELDLSVESCKDETQEPTIQRHEEEIPLGPGGAHD